MLRDYVKEVVLMIAMVWVLGASELVEILEHVFVPCIMICYSSKPLMLVARKV